MKAACYAEWLKLRRSRLIWVTALAITVGLGAGALFLFISLHPGKARELGLLGAKAQVAALEPTWPSFYGLLAQIAAVGGALIFGMTMVWIFGREFADHTAKDLLALPTSRAAIVAAKFGVATGWCLVLSVYLALGGTAVGLLVGVPEPLTGRVMAVGAGRVLITAMLTIAVTWLFGLAASAGRGYLAAVAVLFTVVFTTQIVAALGYGAWFPFSVPVLHSGLTGQAAAPAGYAALAVIAVASVWATLRWWRHADHTR